jgi:hypothetical protein
MKASALQTLGPAKSRRPRTSRAAGSASRSVRTAPTVTDVDGRSIRSLSAGRIRDHSEVFFLAGLGAPGYLATPNSRGNSLLHRERRSTVARTHPVGHGRPPEDQVQLLTMPSVVITGQHDGCFPYAQAADAAIRSFADLLH